jgi:tricorn protease
MAHGLAEFRRTFALAARTHEAVVLDLRFNGGGFVSEGVLDVLSRRVLGYNTARRGRPSEFPGGAAAGPVVLLADENTCSDGDVLCAAFKQRGLGTLVGRRTWGGVTGISSGNNTELVDGSAVNVSSEGYQTLPGAALASLPAVENRGVQPDEGHAVDFAPQHFAAKDDPQLQHAVVVALRQLGEQTSSGALPPSNLLHLCGPARQ